MLTIDSNVCPQDKAVRKALFYAHGGSCFYTAAPLSLESMVVDHIVPMAAGGSDTLANLVPTREYANLLKSSCVNGLTERMVFINRTAFAPRALRRLSQMAGVKAPSEPVVILARLRECLGPDHSPDIDLISDYFETLIRESAVKLGRRGGTARAKKLSKKRRSEIARAAVKAREEKRGKK